jgi:hypothetical protein
MAGCAHECLFYASQDIAGLQIVDDRALAGILANHYHHDVDVYPVIDEEWAQRFAGRRVSLNR